MTENEVNIVSKQWLENNGYKYKGILNAKPKGNYDIGYGQVPVPTDSNSQILIDHQGVNDKDKSIIWIEAKGSDVGMSQLLEGFIRVAYACYYGGGKGLLAIPDKEYQELIKHKGFLAKVSMASERTLGLLNAQNDIIEWITI